MTEPDLRPSSHHPRSRDTGTTKWLVIVLAIAALAYGGWYAREYWAANQRAVQPQSMDPEDVAPAPIAPAPVEPESSATELQELVPDEAPRYPMPDAPQGILSASDTQGLDRMAVQWLGRAGQQFLVMPGLAHHVVATVDNLARSHAAPRLWPLYPVGGRMSVQAEEGGAMYIGSNNHTRYDAVVGFVTGTPAATVVQWYQQAYPVLQQAYEELGFPGKYFNDRVVAVIDHLLQTPEPSAPLALRLVQVQGQVAPQQPWLRYEYADAQWQALSAGQKILLRVGLSHRQALKAYLRALRTEITA